MTGLAPGAYAGAMGERISQELPDLYTVRIPIPAPLRYVNCYLARGADGWTIVDTGFHTEETEAAWREAFRRLGIGPRDVARIVVTHYHPDHYGAAGWLQEWTGAPVLVHEPERATIERVWQPGFPDRLLTLLRRGGVPEPLMPVLERGQRWTQEHVQPRPRLTTVREGDEIPIGDRRFRVIWAPGHTDGLMVLWHEPDGLLLANDMVLADISPNIMVGPHSEPDPLGRYLASLEQVARLPARLVLTGHRRPITDLAGRCAELRALHERRLAAVLAYLDGEPLTAWQVAQRLFGAAIDSPANVMFAVGEAAAHLEYLIRRERVTSEPDEDGVLRFRKAA